MGCDQCGEWLDCGTSLRKHMKKEHGNTSEQDIKTEENKKENNEDKEKSETGIMISDLSKTLQVIKNCGFEYPSKIQHKCIKHVDDQISNKEEKSANTSQKLKWDPGVSIYPLVQLKEVGI